MKRLAIFVLTLSLVTSGALVAGATTKPKVNPHATYALGTAKKCKTDFVKKTEKHKIKGKNVRYVGCVYHAPPAPVKVVVVPVPVPVMATAATTSSAPSTTTTTVAPTPTYSYVAHVDPSFVQSSANPMAVTYTYTADATESVNGQKTDLGQAGNLPGGVLQLYSDGLLACSINVGGATTGGQCGVNYSTYGNHVVTTYYSLTGITPVTETDQENIQPFDTSVAISTPNLGSTVDVNNYAYQVVSVPVTVSGLTTSLGTTGTVSLTNTDAISESCQPLTYNSQLGSSSATCTAEVENNATQGSTWIPVVTFSGDTNYSSSGATGTATNIPVAPAPTVTNDTVTLTCAESGGFCTEYQPSPETTDARANVDAGFDTSPQVGTVTFTSADHLLICTATVYSAANLASNNARCTGTGGPFEGPIQVSYSGGTIVVGDTSETVYSPATAVGGSN